MTAVGSPVVGAAVLLGVLLVGVLVARSKRRAGLLLAGILVLGGAPLLLALVVGGLDVASGPERLGGELAAVYAIAVPLVVAFVAGWFCGRGTWFMRLVVIAVAALLLAAFPYDVVGRVTADAVAGPAVVVTGPGAPG